VTRPPVLVPLAWCPKCGAPMKLIPVGAGNTTEAFYGCTEYRSGCTGKRSIVRGRPELTPEELEGLRQLGYVEEQGP